MEEKILQMMKSLDLTRDEAIALIAEDEEVDRMKMSEVDKDLTPEQRKAIKKVKGGARAVNAYGITVTVQRKKDEAKRTLIETLYNSLTDGNLLLSDLRIANPEREITFKFGKEDFSLTLVRHRPKKKK